MRKTHHHPSQSSYAYIALRTTERRSTPSCISPLRNSRLSEQSGKIDLMEKNSLNTSTSSVPNFPDLTYPVQTCLTISQPGNKTTSLMTVSFFSGHTPIKLST